MVVLWGVRFLISEVPLYEATGQAMDSPSGHPLSSNGSILSDIWLWVGVPRAFSALAAPLPESVTDGSASLFLLYYLKA